MSSHKLQTEFGIDISVEPGSLLRPTDLHLWTNESKFTEFPPQEPFKYMADALLGLSMVRLNSYLKSPLHSTKLNYQFCDEAWRTLDPHFEIYNRTQQRVLAFRKNLSPSLKNRAAIESFEKTFSEIMSLAIHPTGLDLETLCEALPVIETLENELQKPLLYNFEVQFSRQTTEALHSLFSLLYHLRSVIALDHNAHCKDTSVEGIKMDSITDYIPRADYISNDATLYYQFKKLSEPFINHRDKDVRIEKLFVDPMSKMFKQLSHNAVQLIENTPKSFLNRFSAAELDEVLHLVQMDWLLGTETGLLFKIREELYGVQNGYEKIFWPDCESSPYKFHTKLTFAMELNENIVFGKKTA